MQIYNDDKLSDFLASQSETIFKYILSLRFLTNLKLFQNNKKKKSKLRKIRVYLWEIKKAKTEAISIDTLRYMSKLLDRVRYFTLYWVFSSFFGSNKVNEKKHNLSPYQSELIISISWWHYRSTIRNYYLLFFTQWSVEGGTGHVKPFVMKWKIKDGTIFMFMSIRFSRLPVCEVDRGPSDCIFPNTLHFVIINTNPVILIWKN